MMLCLPKELIIHWIICSPTERIISLQARHRPVPIEGSNRICSHCTGRLKVHGTPEKSVMRL